MVHAEYFVCMDIIIKERVFTGFSQDCGHSWRAHLHEHNNQGNYFNMRTSYKVFGPLLGISLYNYPFVQVVALV